MASSEETPGPGPGELLAGSIGFLLSKLGFLTASRFGAALAPLDITPGHFGLLRIVDAFEGCSQQALGEALSIPPSRIVGLVDDLEGRDLLERRRSATDRRVNTLHLTAKGRRVLQKATTIATAWEDELCAGLEAAERNELLLLLRRLAANHELPLGVHPGLVEKGGP